MKNNLLFGALLILLAAGCSKDNSDINRNITTPVSKISIKASINNSMNTRMSYVDIENEGVLKLNWSDREYFALYQGNSSTEELFSKNEEGNTFYGTVPANGTGNYCAVYGYNITNENGILNVSIDKQIGNANIANGITSFMVAKTADLKQMLYFNHKLAVLKLNITFPQPITGKASKVAVYGMHKTANFDLSKESDDEAYSNDNANLGAIEATNGTDGFNIEYNKITAYIAVFPETVEAKQVTIKVIVNDVPYYYTIRNARTLLAGKVVPVNVTLQEVSHSWVNLGLPSGTLWSTMNVGAIMPEDYGTYYSWGETESKEETTWDNYLASLGGTLKYYQDCGTEKDPLRDYVGSTPSKSIIGGEYDVASVKWGSDWQMPTIEQIEELMDETNCKQEWITNYNNSGVNGCKITSLKPGFKGNFIFLPAAGHLIGNKKQDFGTIGFYWSGSPHSEEAESIYIFGFMEGMLGRGSVSRCDGQVVRPVSSLMFS